MAMRQRRMGGEREGERGMPDTIGGVMAFAACEFMHAMRRAPRSPPMLGASSAQSVRRVRVIFAVVVVVARSRSPVVNDSCVGKSRSQYSVSINETSRLYVFETTTLFIFMQSHV